MSSRDVESASKNKRKRKKGCVPIMADWTARDER